MKISNVEIMGLKSAIKASKYPMALDVDKLNSDITPTQIKLGSWSSGEGHDSMLKGIVVQFDMKAPQHFWLQFERYHFQDTVSSQSTMHKIVKMDIDEITTSRVSENTKLMIRDLVDVYNNFNSYEENEIKHVAELHGIDVRYFDTKSELFATIIENLPEGIELIRRVATNYLQLKSMRKQRRGHKMYTWQEFCDWTESLPEFGKLTGIE